MRPLSAPLLAWYATQRRDLPWRPTTGDHPDAYRVLVSEIMLQQTQVATVIPYFNRFMHRFPTLRALADADEQVVLRQWQGLGYYSRARRLHQAARQILADHDGQFPADLPTLIRLPGIGRYTAGAIASIALGQRAPILDGNVARVLCRLYAIRSDPRSAATKARLWHVAEQILPTGRNAARTGDFNSALMDLGATICTPRNPNCPACPLRAHCLARARNLTNRIPPPRPAKPKPIARRTIFCLHRAGRWLVEQRPHTGRWPSMWQFPTRPAIAGTAHGAAWQPVATLHHTLTHRRYIFSVLLRRLARDQAPSAADIPTPPSRLPTRWATPSELDHLPMPQPQLHALALVTSLAPTSVKKARRTPRNA